MHKVTNFDFITACENGQLEVLRYLLSIPQLEDDFDINAFNSAGFRYACAKGHLEVVKYLTSSTELVESGYTLVNPNTNGTQAIKYACERGHLNIMEYLILECNLQLSPTINEFLNTPNNGNKLGGETVLNMFKVSERYHNLESSLEHKSSARKINKI